MSKLYIQGFNEVWLSSASLGAGGSQTSGSFITAGYNALVGILAANASAKSSSGLRIWQSCDNGRNYDYWTDYAPSACSGSASNITIVGNAAKNDYITDGAAGVFRTAWHLRPV